MRHLREDYNRIQDPKGLIPDDEPVFLLRGQDKATPGAIEAWANLVEGMGGDPVLVSHARMWAADIRKWQEQNTAKVPDAPSFPSTPHGA